MATTPIAYPALVMATFVHPSLKAPRWSSFEVASTAPATAWQFRLQEQTYDVASGAGGVRHVEQPLVAFFRLVLGACWMGTQVVDGASTHKDHAPQPSSK